MTNIVTSFDGKNYYPVAVISTTAKSAVLQRISNMGELRGEPKRCRFSKYHNERVCNFDYGLTVYLDEPMTLEEAAIEFYKENMKMNAA